MTPDLDPAAVMLIDDNVESLTLLTRILSTTGMTVRQARSGAMALAAVQARHPDLIILDIRMPEMDGFQVCHRLKSDPRTRAIPIIFISGLDGSQDKTRAFEAGAADYVTKPFQEAEVLARVRHHLELSRMTRKLEDLVAQRTEKLQESNTALKVLLDHRREERDQLEDNMLSQINSLVLPFLKRLEQSGLTKQQAHLCRVTRENLSEITAPFAGKLHGRAPGLTPREMEVAAMIRLGKTNGEIADILNISEPAVSFHRQNLRKKLGLLGKKINLAAHLNTLK